MLPLLGMDAPPLAPPSSKPQQHRLMRTVSISVLVMSLPVLYVSFLHVPPAALFRDTTFWFLMSNSIIIVIAADSGMLFFGSSASCSADDDAHYGGLSFAANSTTTGRAVSVSDDETDQAEAVENRQALVLVREQLAPMVARHDDRAYALVEGEDRTDAAAAVVLPLPAPRQQLTASRSLAAREERPARRRHGHGHRPSRSSSHALVPVQEKSVVVSEERHLRRAATDNKDDGSWSPPPPPAPAYYYAAAEETEKEKESEYSRLSDEELNRRVEEFIARFNREIRLQLEKEEQAAAA